MEYRYLSDMVSFVWSNKALVISCSGILLMDDIGIMFSLITSDLDVLVYTAFKKIN